MRSLLEPGKCIGEAYRVVDAHGLGFFSIRDVGKDIESMNGARQGMIGPENAGQVKDSLPVVTKCLAPTVRCLVTYDSC